MGQKELSLSIVFPCFNDAGTIGKIVADAAAVAQKFASKFEVIVVDDGSTDNSREVLNQVRQLIPELETIFHVKNKGYGGALKTGFQAAKYEWIFYTDGDYQYDVKELGLLLEKASSEVDVVNGYKTKRQDPTHRRIIGVLYRSFAGIAFNLPIRDVDCDFRLMRASLLKPINLEYNSGVICVEMIKKLDLSGARFIEVPVTHLPRTYGSSQFFKVSRIAEVFIDLCRLWFKLMVVFGFCIIHAIEQKLLL